MSFLQVTQHTSANVPGKLMLQVIWALVNSCTRDRLASAVDRTPKKGHTSQRQMST